MTLYTVSPEPIVSQFLYLSFSSGGVETAVIIGVVVAVVTVILIIIAVFIIVLVCVKHKTTGESGRRD